MVACSHQHGTGDIGTNTLQRAACRCSCSHEAIQVTVQGRHFGREELVALRQAPERQLHCGHRGGHRAGAQARCSVDEAIA